MIDINELRRLAQAATPGPWTAAGPSFGESLPKYLNEVVIDREGDEDDGYSICNAPIGLNEECSDDMAFIAEANPLTIEELLDRLEAAEKSDAESIAMYRKARDERDDGAQQLVQSEQGKRKISEECDALLDRIEAAEKDIALKERVIDSLGSELNAVANERDALRARIEAMEKQEPFDADNDVFRSSFEAALKAGNWPATRQGDGYRSPSTQIAWRIAFSTVNRLKLYLAHGAKGE